MGERKNIVSFVSFDGFDQFPFGVLKVNFDPVKMMGVLVNGRVSSRPSIWERPTLFQVLAGSHVRVEPLIRV
jgi:hypothetical protein